MPNLALERMGQRENTGEGRAVDEFMKWHVIRDSRCYMETEELNVSCMP
jgi:hypothetical protein